MVYREIRSNGGSCPGVIDILFPGYMCLESISPGVNV